MSIIQLNPLIPELSVFNLDISLAFYVDVLKFKILYKRPEEGFAFLMLGDAQIMLDQINKGRTWKTDELIPPLGRGINLQIKVASINDVLNHLKEHNIKLFMELEEKRYQQGTHEIRQKQFLVTDPDKYLLRFIEIV